MKPMNIAVKALAIAALSLGVSSGAFAGTVEIGSTISSGFGEALSFTNSTGVFQTLPTGPQFATDDTTAVSSPGSTIALSATESGVATNSSGTITAPFGAGKFQISDAASADLLSGTFTGLKLTSTTPSSAGVLVNVGGSVTYTGGTYLADYDTSIGVAPTTSQTGTLTLGISAVSPNPPGISIATAGNIGFLNTFQTGSPTKIAGFDSEFDVNSSVVPESNGSLLMLAALAPFAIVGMVIRRKQSGSTQA